MFFTIALIITDQTAYLLPFTLDGISKQDFHDFEVLKIAHQGNISEMMNEAIAQANGEYIHFLTPGEFYTSSRSLTLIAEQIHSHANPDLLSMGYIERHSLALPQTFIQPLSIKDLKRGRFAHSLQSHFFRTETLLNLGGFNPDYVAQGGFDMICRFYEDSHLRKTFIRRVLTDYEYRLLPPKRVVAQFFEVFLIICRHFGLSKALIWWTAQNNLRLLRWWFKSVQRAFISQRA